MRHETDLSDIFDDDFEVTYEDGWEDVSDSYSCRRSPVRRADHGTFRRENEDSYEADSIYEDRYGDDSSYEDRDEEAPRSARRRSRRGVPLAAPIRRGGRALSRAAAALIRGLTAVLILATAAYVTYTFWRASTPYGDILESVRTRKISITLAAYLCVAAIFLLFEFIALLWSITRVRVRDELGYRKEDTGRGLISFLLVFASSYLAFLLYRFLPETPEILYGLKGALEVYGSMHNVLFGFCAAGVVSCLVRRYFSH